ncbi:abortive infection family protein [Staphylococcus xylosus]|uniref:abortive infection family protein n=1 Tax=Staphylococcus xylosus TaxID=1288 RepID=UPI001C3C3E69|nr:abortive infection family protein [Staphylococcus xylosus]MBV5141451.1 abortive infection family protein [Staphylococcus xylosus]MBW3125526.1 abortive infection family protein [Staphylococcus xylosus]
MKKSTIIDKFLDLLSSRSSLREIENNFIDADIMRDSFINQKYNGQRKSLAWEYISTLNLEDEAEFSKLLNVIETYLFQWNLYTHEIDEDEEINRLIKIINALGYAYNEDTGRITKNGSEVNLSTVKSLAEKFDVEYVLKECNRIEKEAQTDPEDAITSAKAMVESTLKYILDSEGEHFSNNENLKGLYKKVSENMNLSPGGHNERTFKTILSGMINVINGLDEVRNEYGDAHGKSKKNYKPETRHAFLAINSARTITEFLLASYKK